MIDENTVCEKIPLLQIVTNYFLKTSKKVHLFHTIIIYNKYIFLPIWYTKLVIRG